MVTPRRWVAWTRRLGTILVLLVAGTARLAHAQGAAPVEHERKPVLTKPPALVKFVEAPYPEAEKTAGRSASVVLLIAISATGTVDDVAVVTSAGTIFDEAAIAAVRQFLFTPAEIDNQPAAMRIQYRYQFVLKTDAPTTAVFDGTVKKLGAADAFAGVEVALDDGQKAITDAAGHFHFEKVSPGSHRVSLSRADLKAMQTEETFEAGKKLDATYDVELAPPATAGSEDSDDLEIVIIAPKLTKQIVSTVVEAEQARRVAGTQGDVLKIVESMPGVSRATAGSGAVVVWGAAPEDTRVYVDGVRVPLLYHFGGLRSVVHTDLVRSVELTPGGYGVTYGRGLGGLVTIEKRAPSDDRLHGSVQLDFLDASAQVNGRISDKWRIEGAVRRSHLDWALDQVTSRDVGEFFPIPKYYDGQAAIRYRDSDKEFVEVGGLLSSDTLQRSVASADPAQRKSQTQDLYFDRIYARYEKLPGNGSLISIVPWVGRDHSSLVEQFGGTPTSVDVRSMNYGLRASYRGQVAPFLNANVGLDLEATVADAHRSGSIASPPREGDAHIFGQPPGDQVNADQWNAIIGSAAPYAEGDFGLFSDKLHVIPGLRLEPLFMSVSRRFPKQGDGPSSGAYVGDVSIEPRLSARYALTNRVTFKAAYGKYHQPPAAADLSPVFGNPLLGLSVATHLLFGMNVKLASLLNAETTVFYSHSDGLAVRNPSPAPLLAQALVGAGQGRSFGAQVLLRRELAHGLFGWVAYTLLRSERQDAPGTPYRLFDYDQTHVLTALASYDLGKGYDVGARFRYATGYPRTPVVGAYYDSRRDLYDPVLGTRNTERIPAFVQLDVRFSKRWKLAGTELEAYLDVQNVTDRTNYEEIVYSADYSQKRYIRGLPILPIAGAKWTF
ncbi:MAG TPA: TonB-dependent receptor [Polyangiaceae bacterium]|jgi:TonB family protein|nr:TonB-dependent receptor [Polyangiaceae bacterium]